MRLKSYKGKRLLKAPYAIQQKNPQDGMFLDFTELLIAQRAFFLSNFLGNQQHPDIMKKPSLRTGQHLFPVVSQCSRYGYGIDRHINRMAIHIIRALRVTPDNRQQNVSIVLKQFHQRFRKTPKAGYSQNLAADKRIQQAGKLVQT
jgi:hypothetical protein